MYKVKRTIYVNNRAIDVWLGLVSKSKNGKNGKYTVYLLTDDRIILLIMQNPF